MKAFQHAENDRNVFCNVTSIETHELGDFGKQYTLQFNVSGVWSNT